MELATSDGRAVVYLFLRTLWLCQHHGARFGHVHSVPGRDLGSRRATVSGVVFPGSVFESQCVVDSLWHHTGAHLFRSGLCEPADLVAARALDVAGEHTHLGHCWVCVVEDFGIVVKGKNAYSEVALE